MWQYWPISDLQKEIGENELDFLEQAIPALLDISADSFIGNKRKLASIVESLKDHNYFRQKTNLVKCLWHIPSDEKTKLCNQLNYKGDKNNFKKISSKILSDEESYAKFIGFFGLDNRFLSNDKITLDPFFDNYSASAEKPKTIKSPFKNLKNFQYKCFSDCQELLHPPLSRAILQMPTGSGKTRTASEVIADHLNENGIRQVVWLANTRELCEQAIQCMSEVWDHIGRRTCRFNRLWDGNFNNVKSWKENECVFSVMSLQSGWSTITRKIDKFTEDFAKTSLIIVDEAHIAIAPTYKTVIENLVSLSHCKVLGLTATPGRTIEEETSSLSDLFNYNITALSDPNKKRDNAIAYLRSINVMSKAHHSEIIYENSFKISEKDKVNLQDGNDYSDIVLKKLGKDVYRTISIIRKLKNLLDQGAKIIMFAPSVQNSFLTSSILTFLGYKSVHVSGDTNPKTRDLLIDKYLKGEYQIMCNYGVLATGFDAPNVDVVCIARPTMSPVLYSQMIGRGLRGKAVGGTEECLILEVKDNFIGLPNQDTLYSLYEDYWSN
jgi:DNA repair protein RadD